MVYANIQGVDFKKMIEEVYEIELEEEALDIKEEYLQLLKGKSHTPRICSRGGRLSSATEDLEALGEPSFTLVKPTGWGQIKALFGDWQ